MRTNPHHLLNARNAVLPPFRPFENIYTPNPGGGTKNKGISWQRNVDARARPSKTASHMCVDSLAREYSTRNGRVWRDCRIISTQNPRAVSKIVMSCSANAETTVRLLMFGLRLSDGWIELLTDASSPIWHNANRRHCKVFGHRLDHVAIRVCLSCCSYGIFQVAQLALEVASSLLRTVASHHRYTWRHLDLPRMVP